MLIYKLGAIYSFNKNQQLLLNTKSTLRYERDLPRIQS